MKAPTLPASTDLNPAHEATLGSEQRQHFKKGFSGIDANPPPFPRLWFRTIWSVIYCPVTKVHSLQADAAVPTPNK